MKVFKKIIFVVVGLIALVAISLYLFLKVRDSQAQRTLVHRDSEVVIKVDVDKALMAVAWNALKNPSYYLSKDTAATSSEKSSGLSALIGDIPAHIYLFNLSDQPALWYSLLEISNVDKVQSFICDRMEVDSSQIEREDENWWLSNGRFSFYGNSSKVLLAINVGKADVKKSVVDLWSAAANDFVQLSSLDDFKLDNAKQEVQWQDRAGARGGVDFSAGKISSQWTFSNNLMKLSRKVEARQLPTSNALSLYCSADLRPLLHKYADKLHEFNIPVDRLAAYYGGYFDLQWREQDVMQSDTVISYDYDANFNPIAKKELREEYVPNLVFTVTVSPHLSDYIPEKLFYKIYKTMDGNQVALSTDNNALNTFPMIQQDQALVFTYTRSESVLKHLNWLPGLERILSIHIKGSGGEAFNNLNTEVLLVDRDIHALYQLLK